MPMHFMASDVLPAFSEVTLGRNAKGSRCQWIFGISLEHMKYIDIFLLKLRNYFNN
jgi:hypothetical protein